ncbi:hypothetical protein [Porcincola intestinalis]|uniref:hypothetical protein n=1 Tax=Porcincola intestinalis TaxID=2606632 RepID=UPI002A90DE69|nr:hypothetical protein [Porcincola intestinalis]MDY5579978.1 hypothetical protein [Porcincola intestinalis]
MEIPKWDLIIAHPPCTYLSNVATKHHSLNCSPLNWIEGRTLNRIDGMDFFMRCMMANCEHIAVENPVGIMNTAYRKPDQIIEPFMFAISDNEKVTKKTCLWLKGLPKLNPTSNTERPNNAANGFYPNGHAKTWEALVNIDRAKERSKTFPGIAKAMAEQWGIYLLTILKKAKPIG